MRSSMSSVVGKLTAFIIVLAVLGTGVSFGEEETAQKVRGPKPKSEKLAFLLSLAGTAVPVAAAFLLARDSELWGHMIIGGGLLGPSLGYFYGGIPGRGGVGIGVRGLFLFLATVGAIGNYLSGEEQGLILAYAAGIGGLASAIYDIISVGPAVRKRNKELRETAFFISPIVIPQKRAAGINVHFQF